MPTRREAAELARVLALSTQQTRDIANISPQSLSSDKIDHTQDSRDLELRMIQPVNNGTPADDVGLFSSRSAEDIHSFSLSAGQQRPPPDFASVGGISGRDEESTTDPPEIARLTATEKSPASSSRGPLFSPTQTSGRPIPRQVATYGKADQHGPRQNSRFQLSSSPVEVAESSKPRSAPPTAEPVSSQPEIVEIVESFKPKAITPSSSRSKKYPEVILPARTRPSLAKARESPDPLDSLTGTTRSTLENSQASSSRGDKGIERKSSRVQAAAEKKEAAREEKRRLRRELKAKEAELKGKEVPRKRSEKDLETSDGTLGVQAIPAPIEAGEIQDTDSTELVAGANDHVAPPKKRPRPSKTLDPRPVATAREPTPDAVESVADTTLLGAPKPDSIVAVDKPNAQQDVQPPIAEALSLPESSAQTPEPGLIPTTRHRVAVGSPLVRQSPGPTMANGKPERPDGIRWQTSRDDLSSVLAKFGGAKATGMSRRHRIAPLHAKIGPPAKALPPVPQKPVKKKKGEDSDDEEESDVSEDEEGNKEPKSKKKGLEWFMMED